MTQRRMSVVAKRKLLDFLFEYETAKVVKVYSARLGIINRTVQFILIVYIVGYIFVYAKGYQYFEAAESNTIAKIKGMIKRNFTASPGANDVWDSTDMVTPSVENDATFIATNFIETPSQQSGRCPEDTTVKAAKCASNADCTAGEPVTLGNGFKTGICVLATATCEIEGWCPTEHDVRPDPPLFLETANFTILVKNYVHFPQANIKRRNIPDTMTPQHISRCRYHPIKEPYCPIFIVKDIVDMAGENFSQVARTGAIFSFTIVWDCNLDYSEKYCLPQYRFRRLDSPRETLAIGWNFRHPEYWNDEDGTRRRTLYKFYGIRLVFLTYGKAGRFSAEQFAMNLGSAVGLFGMATIICDFLTDYLLKTSAFRKSEVTTVSSHSHQKLDPSLLLTSTMSRLYENSFHGSDKSDATLVPNEDSITTDLPGRRLFLQPNENTSAGTGRRHTLPVSQPLEIIPKTFENFYGSYSFPKSFETSM